MKTSLIRIVVITVLASCICSQASQITNASTAGPTHVQFEQRLVAFSRNDTDRLDVVFPISQFPFCRGALNRVRVRMVSEVNPLFLGGILLPNIAGVNAQFTCRFFLSAPGVSSAIPGTLYFNESGTFNAQTPIVTIDYAPQTFTTDFQDIPSSALTLYRGDSAVSMPMRVDCVQEATVSNTGMICQFATDITITVEVIYDYTPPPVSAFAIRSIAINESGEVILSWDSVSCVDYLVQDSADIASQNWNTLGRVMATTLSTSVLVSRNSMTRRFFRVVAAP